MGGELARVRRHRVLGIGAGPLGGLVVLLVRAGQQRAEGVSNGGSGAAVVVVAGLALVVVVCGRCIVAVVARVCLQAGELLHVGPGGAQRVLQLVGVGGGQVAAGQQPLGEGRA